LLISRRYVTSAAAAIKGEISVMTSSRKFRTLLVAALSLGVLAPVSMSGVATATDGIYVDPLAKQIVFEATAPATVILPAGLATRSAGGNLVKSGSGPYTMSGTDSGGNAYSFETDCNYGSAPQTSGCSSNLAPNLKESDQRTGTITTNRTIGNYTDSASVTVANAVSLTSTGGIDGPNPGTFGSIFGPEVYTESFSASAGQNIAFRYSALGTGDEYEIYAFLVEVSDDDYADGVHTLVAHARGKNQRWKTIAGVVPTTGTYRFRFVNGTYDGSGGLAVGSNMYIDPAIWLGEANAIAMDTPADKVKGDADQSFPISAKPTSAGPVFFSTDPTSRCTVGAATRDNEGRSHASVTIKSSGTAGQCTIFASSNQFGPYVPAPQIFRNFNVCASNLADGGGHSISGTVAQGERLEFNVGTITSCGDNYNIAVQWQKCVTGNCTLDSHFENVGPSFNKSGMSTDTDAKGRLSLDQSLVSYRLRAKMTVTDGDNTVVFNSALVGPVLAVDRTTTTTSVAGPVSEPKPFVLPTGDTPRVEPGKAIAYEGGAPVVLTTEPVTVGGVQSVKLGGTTAGGGKFEMTIGGDCPTCEVTQSNTGDSVLGMEQAAAVRVGGYGFATFSQVNVFVSSTTRLIGFFKADGDGAFLGSVKVPNDLPKGNHTIQVSGFTADNVIRSVSVGITVDKATPKGCRVVKKKGKKPVTVCSKKKVTKKKKK